MRFVAMPLADSSPAIPDAATTGFSGNASIASETRLAYDVVGSEQRADVSRLDAQRFRNDLAVRVDCRDVLAQCFRLRHSDLRREILLPVQVRGLHSVEVDYVQVPDSCASQRYGNVGAKSSKPAYRHAGGVELRLSAGAVPRREGCVESFPVRNHLSRPP